MIMSGGSWAEIEATSLPVVPVPLKARSIPIPLSIVGLVASLTLIVGVPLQTAAGRNTVDGVSAIIWIPMFIFEVSAGLWLLIKGARTPEIERTDQVVVSA